MPARVLIVDDNLSARTTIRSLLEWHSFQMCGEAANGKEAIERVIELKPAIVLLDINMRVMSGTEAAMEIRRLAPQTKIVFFTIHDAPIRSPSCTRSLMGSFQNRLPVQN